MVCQVLSHLVPPLAFRNPPSWSTLSRTLPPFGGWFLLDTLICFLCQVQCFMIIIMSLPIFLWSFRLIPCLLVGFLRMWPFIFHLSITLDFLTLNSMYWHKTRGVLSLVVLRRHAQGLSSIPCGNPKILASYYRYWIGSLMGGRGKSLKLIYNVLTKYLNDLWDTLGLHVPILPPIFFPWASFAPLSFGEQERS